MCFSVLFYYFYRVKEKGKEKPIKAIKPSDAAFLERKKEKGKGANKLNVSDLQSSLHHEIIDMYVEIKDTTTCPECSVPYSIGLTLAITIGSHKEVINYSNPNKLIMPGNFLIAGKNKELIIVIIIHIIHI